MATGRYVGEGFDLPRLDTLFLAMPVSWKGTLAQYAGRLHRNYEGKQEVIIYDYVDFRIPMLERMYHKRLDEGSFKAETWGKLQAAIDLLLQNNIQVICSPRSTSDTLSSTDSSSGTAGSMISDLKRLHRVLCD